MYLDWTYIVLVLPAVLFSLWASARVNRIFSQYSAGRTRRGMTGAAAARAVLDAQRPAPGADRPLSPAI